MSGHRTRSFDRPELTPERYNQYDSSSSDKSKSLTRYYRLVGSDRVEVLIGPEPKVFKLPKDLLAEASPYMDACFNGKFKEANDAVLKLKGTTVRA
jgi:hypothetical protein